MSPASITRGIDVSSFQGAVDWSAVAASGIGFTFVKATEGATFVDSRFAVNWAGAKAARLPRGAYHYYRPQRSNDQQVANMLRTIGTLDDADLPPVMDLEEQSGWSGSISSRVARVEDFLGQVRTAFGRTPIVYTIRSFMNGVLGGPTTLGGFPLWVVDISRTPPRLPRGWADWQFWQHSFEGTSPGIAGKVDLDRFQGTPAELAAFIASTKV